MLRGWGRGKMKLKCEKTEKKLNNDEQFECLLKCNSPLVLVFPRHFNLNILRIRHYKKLLLCIHISGIHCKLLYYLIHPSKAFLNCPIICFSC